MLFSPASLWDKVSQISHAAFLKGSHTLSEVTILSSAALRVTGFKELHLAVTQPEPGCAQISEVMRPSSDLPAYYKSSVLSRV